MSSFPSRLVFGIYPGGPAGGVHGMAAGKPDDPAKINEALDQLQGNASQLLVRAYVPFGNHDRKALKATSTAKKYAEFDVKQRKLDMVLTFSDKQGDVDGWTDFIRETIQLNEGKIAALQIAEEPNLTLPPGDGRFPRIAEAVVEGVVAAKEEVRRLGLDTLVGFNTVKTPDVIDPFWDKLSEHATDRFREALDYVGVDLFPDVFKSLGDITMQEAVLYGLSTFRKEMDSIGLAPEMPIHITEHGWPTTLERTYERQAQVLDDTVRTIMQYQQQFHVSHYEFFSLRDADSFEAGIFYQFGLMRDDYTPKPAFEVFKRLVAEFGA